MNPSVAEFSVSTRPRVAIMGVPFDHLTLEAATRSIERMIASGRCHYLVTANVDFLVQARGDAELRRILLDADLVLCDGTPLVWASRLLGNPLPERVAGSDLVPHLLNVASQKKYSVFLLGAKPDSASRAVDRLRTEYPELLIAGHYSPPFNPLLEMDHAEIRNRICAAAPDLLLVSFGCPKQEKWMAMHYRSLGVPVTIGVGATIDFLGGQHRRAPMWMRKSGTEWLYRLAREPRRLFARYTNDFWVFGRGFLAQYWHLQVRSRTRVLLSAVPARASQPVTAAPPAPEAQKARDHCLIQLPARMDLAALQAGKMPSETQVNGSRYCFFQAENVRHIDSTGLGELMRWDRKLRSQGGNLVLIAPSTALRRALSLMRLNELFVVAPDLATAEKVIRKAEGDSAGLVEVEATGEKSRIRWSGEVTAANADAIWEQTAACFNRLKSANELSIDLQSVRFVDSSGLGVMIRAKKLARDCQKSLSFCNLQPLVQNVIRLARLEGFLLEAPAPRRLLPRLR